MHVDYTRCQTSKNPVKAILKYTDLQNTDIHFGAPTFVVFGYVYKHYSILTIMGSKWDNFVVKGVCAN